MQKYVRIQKIQTNNTQIQFDPLWSTQKSYK